MSNQEYLQNLLESQNLSDNQLNNLRDLRDKIEAQLRNGLSGNPVFYYGGSYAKHTMIKDSYDLDIVVYWPQNTSYTLKNIFDGVGTVLKNNWKHPNPKTVAWQISFEGDFHIDVVPGRSLDSNNKYANLYNNKSGGSLKTSLKVHIDTIRNSDRRDAIRLIKLWKSRKNLPFKTFILEQMVIEGCKGSARNNLEKQLMAAFNYIYEKIGHSRIIDPANSNNVISSEMTGGEKTAVRNAAKSAIDAKSWSEVFSGN